MIDAVCCDGFSQVIAASNVPKIALLQIAWCDDQPAVTPFELRISPYTSMDGKCLLRNLYLFGCMAFCEPILSSRDSSRFLIAICVQTVVFAWRFRRSFGDAVAHEALATYDAMAGMLLGLGWVAINGCLVEMRCINQFAKKTPLLSSTIVDHYPSLLIY